MNDMNFDGRASINGQRVAASRAAVFDCVSPVDGRILTQVARCDSQDIDLAVAAARQAFEDRRWRGKSPAQRKRVLIRFADLLLEHMEALALTETLNMGKPIQYARTVDVKGAANCIRWYGEAIDKVYGQIAPTADTALALITQEPVGVVVPDAAPMGPENPLDAPPAKPVQVPVPDAAPAPDSVPLQIKPYATPGAAGMPGKE